MKSAFYAVIRFLLGLPARLLFRVRRKNIKNASYNLPRNFKRSNQKIKNHAADSLHVMNLLEKSIHGIGNSFPFVCKYKNNANECDNRDNHKRDRIHAHNGIEQRLSSSSNFKNSAKSKRSNFCTF